MADPIYLIDGSSLVFRAHFAFVRSPLTTSGGKNVSAVYGFAQTLFTLLRSEGARYAAVAFDTGAPTFRHERYPAYKANRPPVPEELIEQIPLVRALVEALGLQVLERDGVEADDLIASLAATVVGEQGRVVIVSADKDFNQLVSPSVRQWIPPRGRGAPVELGPAEVIERWGVEPPKVLEILALMGDAVDNIPGVRGIGEKTARELIRSFGDLETLYRNLESVPRPAVREKLRAGREDAFLSRELVRLRTDLLPDEKIEGYRVVDPRQRPALLELLRSLEFRRLIDSLDLRPADGWTARYETVDTEESLRACLARLPAERAILAIDTETDSLDARRTRAVGISLAWEPGVAYYLPVGHEAGPNLEVSVLRRLLGPVLAEEGIEKVGQNLKFDLHVLERLGLELRGPLFDTLLASYLLDPDRPHDLDALTFELLGHRKIPIGDLIGRGKEQTTMDRLAVEKVRDYAAEDADAALRLRGCLLASLRERGQEELFRTIEAPLVPVLVAMERTGVHVDVAALRALSAGMESDLARLAEEVYRHAGTEFNINSPAQLAEILFDRLKLPRGRKTKTGYSTDQEVLERLALEAPIARAVLAYRQTSKLRSTYVEALPKLVDPETGRIHAQFHQRVAATGRLSSSDPNLQNIPVRTEQGRRIRQAFVPQRAGEILVSADYSQIELRILAHLSRDEGLLAAFRAGEDIHAATAARIFDVPVDRVDPVMRGRAKTVNFGVLYGMGPVRLARSLGIPVAEARAFIEQYFAKMPGVQTYLEESLARARRDGYVSTLLGRRRYLPGLQGENARSRAQAERIAANTPIQGSAADLIKKAMIRIHALLHREQLETRLILQVHDELLFEGPEKERERLIVLVRRAMEGAVELLVPLRVDVGWGSSWDEAHG